MDFAAFHTLCVRLATDFFLFLNEGRQICSPVRSTAAATVTTTCRLTSFDFAHVPALLVHALQQGLLLLGLQDELKGKKAAKSQWAG